MCVCICVCVCVCVSVWFLQRHCTLLNNADLPHFLFISTMLPQNTFSFNHRIIFNDPIFPCPDSGGGQRSITPAARGPELTPLARRLPTWRAPEAWETRRQRGPALFSGLALRPGHQPASTKPERHSKGQAGLLVAMSWRETRPATSARVGHMTLAGRGQAL